MGTRTARATVMSGKNFEVREYPIVDSCPWYSTRTPGVGWYLRHRPPQLGISAYQSRYYPRTRERWCD